MTHKTRWDDLQFIYAVARHGSLSGAARELGVNHATVLRRITAVEAIHGVKIFERPPGGYRVRPEGRDLLEALKTMGRSADHLDRLLPTIGQGLEGSVRITTTDTLADVIMPRYLAALRETHSKLNVQLVVSNAIMDPDRPEAELTIRPSVKPPDGLAARLGARMTLTAFRADHTPPTAPWLGMAGPLMRSPLRDWQADLPDGAIGLTADRFATLARLAEQGLGPAMLPAFLGASCAALSPIPGAPQFETSIWVAAHPDLMRLERVKVLSDFFVKALSQDPRLPG